jgi:hypothetical protein
MCSCGITGHFRKYCYRDGKKRNPRSGGGKKTTKEETSHDKSESCFSLSESCFSLQAKVETDRGRGLSTGPLKSPPTMPTIDQPKEVIFASFQYSEGNDRWVTKGQGREL